MQIYQAMSPYFPPVWEGPPRLVSCAKSIHRLRGPQQGIVNQALRARIEVIKLLVFSMIEFGKDLFRAVFIGAFVICPLELIPSLSLTAFKGLVDASKLGIAILITSSVGLVRPEISIICYQKLALLRPKNALIENISKPWVYLPLAGITTFLLSNAMTRFCDRVNSRFAFHATNLAYALIATRSAQSFRAAARSHWSPIASAWNGTPSLVSCAKNIRWLRGPQQGLFKRSFKSRLEVIKLIAVSVVELGRRLVNKKLAEAVKLGVAILISGSVGLVRPEISLICYQQFALIRPKTTFGEIAQQLAVISPVVAFAASGIEINRVRFVGIPFQIPAMLAAVSFASCSALFLGNNPRWTPGFLRPFVGLGPAFRIPELNENPLRILRLIDGYCKNPLSRISFVESDGTFSPGLDSGGLTRVLYSRLFASLVTNGVVPAQELHRIQGTAVGQLNFMSAENDKVMPFFAANDNLHAEKMNGFQTVGKLMARCKLQKFTIGQLFSTNLYRMVCSFSPEELINADQLPDNVRIRLVQVARSQESAEVRRYFALLQRDVVAEKEYAELLGLAEMGMEGDIPSDRTVMTSINLAWVKKTILENSERTILPAFWIAKGMHQILGDYDWNALIQAGPEEMQDVIEGSLDRRVVRTKMMFEGCEDAITQGFAYAWVDAASKEQLRKFIFFTTGSNSLGREENIFLYLYRPVLSQGNSKRLPYANTCSKRIAIPIVYADQDEFNRKIDLALNSYPVASSQSGFERR